MMKRCQLSPPNLCFQPKGNLMSKLRSVFVLSAVAAAVSLTACGGGDDPVVTPVAASNLTVNIDATKLAETKSLVAAMGNVELPIESALAFPKGTADEDGSAPAGSKLTISPSTNPQSLGKFTLTMPNSTDKVEGEILPGSCDFRPSVVVGSTFRFTPLRSYIFAICRLTLPTINIPVGEVRPILPTIIFNNLSFRPQQPVNVIINSNGSLNINNSPTNSNLPTQNPTGS